ncbi:MAG: butyrate kinase, partial [Spirochaetaceae bacterium]
MTARRILVLNPGSTSTKVSVFEDEHEVDASSVAHDSADLSEYPTIAAQHPMRLGAIRSFLRASAHSDARFDAVVGRGGLLKPVDSGVYRVNDAMKRDLRSGCYGEHASNLGALLADELADELAAESGCDAFIADPVVVDELDDVARYSGLPQIARRSIFHALNQKSAA